MCVHWALHQVKKIVVSKPNGVMNENVILKRQYILYSTQIDYCSEKKNLLSLRASFIKWLFIIRKKEKKNGGKIRNGIQTHKSRILGQIIIKRLLTVIGMPQCYARSIALSYKHWYGWCHIILQRMWKTLNLYDVCVLCVFV